jgi:hypothetical protein
MTTLCGPVPAWIPRASLRQVGDYIRACLDLSEAHAPDTVRDYHCDDSIDDNNLGSTMQPVARREPIHEIEYP